MMYFLAFWMAMSLFVEQWERGLNRDAEYYAAQLSAQRAGLASKRKAMDARIAIRKERRSNGRR